MRTLLYTGHDRAYKPLADITVPRMAEYAERRGFDFTCYTEPLIDVPNGIYWTGVCGALKAFDEGYDSVMYLDVDQLITNYKKEWDPMVYGFHVSKDWGRDAVEPWQFSMCGFCAMTCSIIFREVLDLEPNYRHRPFPEQLPMQEWVKTLTERMAQIPMTGNNKPANSLVNVHSRKVFNCVPDEICPGNVPEPWEPGDFAAHLTMVPLEKRIDIAGKILRTL